jgi:hypothetical protein
MGYAAQVSELLGRSDLTDLVLHALDDMALDSGFLRAGPAISELKPHIAP